MRYQSYTIIETDDGKYQIVFNTSKGDIYGSVHLSYESAEQNAQWFMNDAKNDTKKVVKELCLVAVCVLIVIIYFICLFN